MAQPDPATLRESADWLEAALAQVDKTWPIGGATPVSATPHMHAARAQALRDTLAACAPGARLRTRWDGSTLRWRGVTSSGTAGDIAAAQNWIAAARRKAAALATCDIATEGL